MDEKDFVPSKFLCANQQFLDEKKPQTTYKIEYVSTYVEKWLYVVSNVPEVKNVNFVDCMCNAGIYTDGGKGTAIKVFELFNQFALQHKDKTFNLILNDINSDRLRIITSIIKDYIGVKATNIHIDTRNMDANDFLSDGTYFNQYFNCYPMRSSNLVFVDPYAFSVVRISVLKRFLSQAYCELIFNVFTSDFVRNQDKGKMKNFCEEEHITYGSKEGVVKQIVRMLKVGDIKYSFAYEFKTTTNTEIYQIMFFTPNIKGLEKLKEALWDTFRGKNFYRNQVQQIFGQMSLLTEKNEKDGWIDTYSPTAKELLLERFSSQGTISYIDIESFIIENTMLNGNQILKYVLKPLIQDGKVKKLGNVEHVNNYKDDKYIVGVSKNENKRNNKKKHDALQN